MTRPLLLGGAASLLGVALVVVSGILERWSREWASAVTLTVGTAVALATVFYWLNRTLDHHVQAVERRVESTETAVDQVQGELDQQRRDLDAIMRERLDPANHPVARTLQKARDHLAADNVVEAIRAAREDGSLGDTSPRVPLRGANTFWVRVDEKEGQLTLQLGRVRRVLGLAPIMVEDGRLEDALTVLGQLVQSIAGEMKPQPEHILPDVLDLLELGRTHEKRKGLFARVGVWGAAGRNIVSLDDRPIVTTVATNNSAKPLAGAPRNLTEDEKEDYLAIQSISVERAKMFSLPKS